MLKHSVSPSTTVGGTDSQLLPSSRGVDEPPGIEVMENGVGLSLECLRAYGLALARSDQCSFFQMAN